MSAIEQQIIDRLAAAGIRLRNDKVVREMMGTLKAVLADAVPEGQAVLITCTAPIRLSGKTTREVERRIGAGLAGGEILGNQIHIRRVTGLAAGLPKVLGFVHNPGLDGGAILDMAEATLSSSRS